MLYSYASRSLDGASGGASLSYSVRSKRSRGEFLTGRCDGSVPASVAPWVRTVVVISTAAVFRPWSLREFLQGQLSEEKVVGGGSLGDVVGGV